MGFCAVGIGNEKHGDKELVLLEKKGLVERRGEEGR